ncbi:hypothetical protein HK096_001085, partial [Nowakowskiella sp. JEL0078]
MLCAFAVIASAQGISNKWCNTDGSWCVQSLYQSSTKVISFAVSSTGTGWTAFGIGSGMSNANIMVGWTGPNSVPIVSERVATQHIMPVPVNTPVILAQNQSTALWSAFPVISNHTTRFVVGRFVSVVSKQSKNVTVGLANYMWAFSNTKVLTPASVSSNFTKHSNKGVFTFDFTADISAASVNTTTDTPIVSSVSLKSTKYDNWFVSM